MTSALRTPVHHHLLTGPSSADPIPLVDLRLQHSRIAREATEAVEKVMDSAAFVLGPEVSAFEDDYAAFCDVSHCIGVGNGTDALELALRGLGIADGDEVIVPANTFVATAEAVVRAGASLVLADCDENYLIDPMSLADALTSRTRAVIGVDLYGQIADIEALCSLVGESVAIVEDAAQSQGATRWGQYAGSFGIAAATSFYPGKNLGAYGDGGAVLTNDNHIADCVRALRNHGGQQRYEHRLVGTNSRLDSIQAAVLSIKLQHLKRWNAERAEAAARYAELLAGSPQVIVPRTLPGNSHVWHLFVVRVPHRTHVLNTLNAAGIGAGLHYPAPVHKLRAFTGLTSGRSSFPTAERLAGEILSLPIFPGITAGQQERVVSVLLDALQQ
jgi:dTDP-4-amino-4,6-dideoxygalactose transaminase